MGPSPIQPVTIDRMINTNGLNNGHGLKNVRFKQGLKCKLLCDTSKVLKYDIALGKTVLVSSASNHTESRFITFAGNLNFVWHMRLSCNSALINLSLPRREARPSFTVSLRSF